MENKSTDKSDNQDSLELKLNNQKNKTIHRKSFFAAIIGNALEWYDYIIFAFLTTIIADLFFPLNLDNPDDLTSILKTTAIFGAGFIMRPIGGIVLGLYADKFGRKSTMVLITGLMAISMAMITFAPTFNSVGIFAPIIILLARLIQGFSAGGEYGTSTALLIELAPKNKKGYYGSWQMSSQMMSLVIAASIGTLMTIIFSVEQQYAWAWRLPFAFGLLTIPVAIFIRKGTEEPEGFKELKRKQYLGQMQQPKFWQMMIKYKKEVLIGIGLITTMTITNYIVSLYLVVYASKVLNFSLKDAFITQMAGAVLAVIIIPYFGKLTDIFGRKKLMIISNIGYLIVIFPVYIWLLNEPNFFKLISSQLIFMFFYSAYCGGLSTAMSELFPIEARSTCMSMSYNISSMVFGGFASAYVTWLLIFTKSDLAPAFYIFLGLVLGLIATIYMKENIEK